MFGLDRALFGLETAEGCTPKENDERREGAGLGHRRRRVCRRVHQKPRRRLGVPGGAIEEREVVHMPAMHRKAVSVSGG